MPKKLRFSTSLPIDILREGDSFIAYCPVLDLPVAGKTYEDAVGKFSCVAQAFLDEMNTAGTLNDYLAEMGWQKKQDRWLPPELVGHTEQVITQPR